MASSALLGQGDEGLPSVDPTCRPGVGQSGFRRRDVLPPGGAFQRSDGGTSARRRCTVGTSAACNACAVSTMRLACSPRCRRAAAGGMPGRAAAPRRGSSSRISQGRLAGRAVRRTQRAARTVRSPNVASRPRTSIQRLAVAGGDFRGELDGVVDQPRDRRGARKAMCPTLLSAAQRSSLDRVRPGDEWSEASCGRGPVQHEHQSRPDAV